MKFSIGKKLAAGFGLILLLMIISSALSYQKVIEMEEIDQRLTELRYPTIVAGRDLVNGINHSLAGLRGYMILGATPEKGAQFKQDRAQAWQEIDQAVKQLDQFAANWTDPANKDRLREIKSVLSDFRIAQQRVEDSSHSAENVPAFKLLLTEAAPRAGKIVAALSGLIDNEMAQPATPERKQFLKLLADSRGSFAMGLANIRAFLLSGDIQFRNQFNALWQKNSDAFAQLERQAALVVDAQSAHWRNYQRLRAEFADLPPRMFKLRQAPDWNQANFLLGTEAAPRAAKLMSLLKAMQASQEQLMNQDKANLAAAQSSLNALLISLPILAIIISTFIAWLIGRHIVSALKLVLTRAQAISRGDLSGADLSYKGNDEFGDLVKAVNAMSGSLRNIVQGVIGKAQEVTSGATELAASNSQIAQGIEEQAEQAASVSAAIEQVSASTLEVARNNQNAAGEAEKAGNTADNGSNIVTNTIAEMQKINELVKTSARSVSELGERNKEIDAIIEVINGIANQTNLLALNAAIEAARAGENGRGFAVVADEVRELALRTTQATEEISASIKAIQNETAQAVNHMEAGTEQVETGMQQALDAGKALSSIVQQSQTVRDNIQSIAATSEEQSQTMSEIAQNIDRIVSVSEQSAVATSQGATATEHLSKSAEEMLTLVQQFKLDRHHV